MNINVKFEVNHFVDDGVDYGYYVVGFFDGFTIEDIDCEDFVVNQEIDFLFSKFGKIIDYENIALINDGYKDKNGELFYKNKKNAETVAKLLQNHIDKLIKKVS